jgi:hypothetical protein
LELDEKQNSAGSKTHSEIDERLDGIDAPESTTGSRWHSFSLQWQFPKHIMGSDQNRMLIFTNHVLLSQLQIK